MLPILTAQQMRELDRLTIERVGIGSLVLMETAGCRVADAIARRRSSDEPVLVLVGLGNNGGDAVVAARYLSNLGFGVTLLLAGDPKSASKDLKKQLQIMRQIGLEPIGLEDSSEEDLEDDIQALLDAHPIVVDGLFGTGLTRPIEGRVKTLIDQVNASGAYVISIDLPSGVSADSGQVLGAAIRADLTACLALPKIGHALYPGRGLAGEVEVLDIGIPYNLIAEVRPRTFVFAASEIEEALPPRDPDAHKGTFGHLLVVAGTRERPGSALLAARAAMRSGVGLCTIASDKETIARLAPSLSELLGLELEPWSKAAVISALEQKTALVIGPSLPTDPATTAEIKEILLAAKLPVVVDAGALESLRPDAGWLKRRKFPTVLTPHPGEMGRLLGIDTEAVQQNRVGVARGLAEQSGSVVVLKGASTVVAEPDGTIAISSSGNPGMASAGMGDVLSGVIGALLAQGVEPGKAARAGVQLHAEAGDRAYARAGEVRLIASDVIDELARTEQDPSHAEHSTAK